MNEQNRLSFIHRTLLDRLEILRRQTQTSNRAVSATNAQIEVSIQQVHFNSSRFPSLEHEECHSPHSWASRSTNQCETDQQNLAELQAVFAMRMFFGQWWWIDGLTGVAGSGFVTKRTSQCPERYRSEIWSENDSEEGICRYRCRESTAYGKTDGFFVTVGLISWFLSLRWFINSC